MSNKEAYQPKSINNQPKFRLEKEWLNDNMVEKFNNSVSYAIIFNIIRNKQI